MVITLVKLSARNSYPAVCSSMAGGKETRVVLPLALVHTQVSRDVRRFWIKKHILTFNTVNIKHKHLHLVVLSYFTLLLVVLIVEFDELGNC